MSDVDVLIVGGGISGLAVAWWLAERGVSAELWEQEARAGGKIASRVIDGYLVERAASMMLNFTREVDVLLARTGLEAHKVKYPRHLRRYIVDGGRLAPLPMRPGAVVSSPLWSIRAKLRLLAEPFIARARHGDETVSEFIIRRLGRELLDKAVEPFVAATLASDPDRASAHAALPRLTALEQRYGSLVLGMLVHRLLRRRTACAAEMFSFGKGMATLTDALAHAGRFRIGLRHAVVELLPRGRGWLVVGQTPEGERSMRVRHLVLSVPADAAARLVSPFDGELSRLLGGIEYAPLTVVHLGFDRPAVAHALDGMGFLVPRREALPLTGVQWVSSVFPGRVPRGKALLTSYLGGARCPQVRDWDDDRSVAAAMQALVPMLGIRSEPEVAYIDRHRQALPLYHDRYRLRLQCIAEHLRRWPGLHIVSNYRGGVSVRDRLTCARVASEEICRSMGVATAACTAAMLWAPGRAAGLS